MTTIGSLCTGVGGLDLAAEQVFGPLTHLWHAENEPAAAQVLAVRWPGVPNLGDVTAVNWAAVPPVDVLTAGFPCGDASIGGLRAGLGPDTRTGVWIQVARCIAALQPKVVLIENVEGLHSVRAHSDLERCPWCMGDGPDQPVLRASGAVCGDLAGIGFDADWVTVPACDVGAPHERSRVFFVAWPAGRAGDIPPVVGAGPDHLKRVGALLPTPAARDWRSGASNIMDRNSRPLNEVLVNVYPTATVRSAGWGPVAPSIARWERIIGRPAPDPTGFGSVGQVEHSARFAEWLMGWPDGWVCDAPGLTRKDHLRIVGNGVLPRQAAYAYRSLLPLNTPAFAG